MKKILTIFLCILLFSCTTKTEFVKLSPVNGTFELMLESGELGKLGSVQTYFISHVKEAGIFYEQSKRIKLEQGFIVMNLKRTPGDKNDKPYQLLDSLNECERAFNVDIGINSNWSDEEKKYWQHMRDNAHAVRTRFFTHVKINVEQTAIKTGISQKGFLSYENQE